MHYADFGGSGPPLVLVHGLGGSHLNWSQVGPALAKGARVLALDLVGFGLTPLAGRSASLRANVDLLGRFIDAVVGEPAILVGNSMGGTVALVQAAERPERVAGLVLVNPAQPQASRGRPDPRVLALYSMYAVPGVGEWFVRSRGEKLGAEGVVRRMLSLCCPDLSRLPDEVVRQHVALCRRQYAEMPWTHDAFLEAARSMLWLILRKGRHAELEKRVRAPTLLVQGTADRLVPVAASRELASRRPDWMYVEFAGVGHVPMMEIPERFAEVLQGWLAGPGRKALEGGARLRAAS